MKLRLQVFLKIFDALVFLRQPMYLFDEFDHFQLPSDSLDLPLFGVTSEYELKQLVFVNLIPKISLTYFFLLLFFLVAVLVDLHELSLQLFYWLESSGVIVIFVQDSTGVLAHCY